MSKKMAINKSISNLGRALRSALRLDRRSRLRSPANGKLYLFFGGKDGEVQLEEVHLKDIFAGGFAFRSHRLICIGNHICISDGVDAVEASVENRREDGSAFIYSVRLGQLSPLVEFWQDRLEPEVSLVDVLRHCKELCSGDRATVRAT